ncbi:hypothetical protein HPB51_023579 [Rhipicephalus microplus]|uniref:Uncharacterized protein n=1 Tax=Rhipicephalus microplus TaxID=6941 RepID=A0A9J6DDC4_RHIMP|nr:hypothetical protein HPB51_023579 [Rhipicephalus microplus]
METPFGLIQQSPSDFNWIETQVLSYNQAPPGLIQEAKENPEDCIPDLPENRRAREFLSKAPTKGLWMPLGKQVKVMKCA